MVRVFTPLAHFVDYEISKIKYIPKDRDNYNGKIGEILVEYAVKWFFWIRDFKIDISGDKTFFPNILYVDRFRRTATNAAVYLNMKYNDLAD